MQHGQRNKHKNLMKIKRLTRFEFWPFWLFYIPTYFNWAILAIKAGYTTYFTAANPLMNNSGAVNVSKWGYLSRLPQQWLPKTQLIHRQISSNALKEILEKAVLSFPLILKPDRGERGKEVHLTHDFKQLFKAIGESRYSSLLLQEYCDYPHEVGILFYRYPNQRKGHITSITTKEFCALKGDGKSTWKMLLRDNFRVNHRYEELLSRTILDWDAVAPKGQTQLIEPIGSHNLGTKFINANVLKSSALEARIHQWADQLPGFYYGRFDIKYDNWNTLIEGKDFSLMEINGVNAEPTHIYDPSFSLLKAYRDIFSHMKIIYEISQQNRSLGIQPKRLKPFLTELIKTATR